MDTNNNGCEDEEEEEEEEEKEEEYYSWSYVVIVKIVPVKCKYATTASIAIRNFYCLDTSRLLIVACWTLFIYCLTQQKPVTGFFVQQ